MFAGSHQLTIDDKGRLAIPARFRQKLEGEAPQLYLTVGPNPCLEIFPAAEFQRLADQIEAMEDRVVADRLNQVVIGYAVETEIDRQGRILVPPMLRKRARLHGSVVLMGQNKRMDLWADEAWNERFGEGPASVMVGIADAFRALRR
ncbi:MAG TPA: division/cell wall cluster transcriptional repressor MraZ [Nevskiaceae bacterium]|nr:division/cell wall cluster transcriptional repressor MraZ [Nevskiaceae bacterium]